MLITFISCLVSFVALFIFQQLGRLGDVPSIIIVLVVTSFIADVAIQSNVSTVLEELQKNSEIGIKDTDLNMSYFLDTGLLLYGIVYVILFTFFVIELFIGLSKGELIARLILPSLFLFAFDTIFNVFYCEKKVTKPENRKMFLYYHEARFLYGTFTTILKIIFAFFLLTLPIAAIAFTIMFFVWIF